MKESDFDKELVMPIEDDGDDREIEDLIDREVRGGEPPRSIRELLDRKVSQRRFAETIGVIPSEIDTLQDDFACPVDLGNQCGLINNDLDESGNCRICGFQEFPESLGPIDTTQRARVKQRQQQNNSDDSTKGRSNY